MIHTRLPKNMESPTIAKMKLGDIGYTVPWAMAADRSRALWIRGDYGVYAEPGGTVSMKIQRTGEGIRVFRETVTDTYSPDEPVNHDWQPLNVYLYQPGTVTDDGIPVGITWNPDGTIYWQAGV